MSAMTPKVVERFARETDQTVQCEVCGQTTRSGKPFCPAHVEQSPYVTDLLQRLAAREREQRAVLNGDLRAIDLGGDTACEIYELLRYYGSRSIPRLARDLNLPGALVLRYLRAYLRAGHPIELRVDTRGKPLARFLGWQETARGLREAV